MGVVSLNKGSGFSLFSFIYRRHPVPRHFTEHAYSRASTKMNRYRWKAFVVALMVFSLVRVDSSILPVEDAVGGLTDADIVGLEHELEGGLHGTSLEESRVEEIFAQLCQMCRRRKRPRCIVKYCISHSIGSLVDERRLDIRINTRLETDEMVAV